MKRRLSVTAAIAVAVLVLASATQAHAIASAYSLCRQGLTKSSLTFFGKVLKLNEKCNDKNLKATGTCDPNTVTGAIPLLAQKLGDGMDKKCPTTAVTPAALFGFMGYPGKCSDPNTVDGFTYADLKDCMVQRHIEAANKLLAIEYNTTSQLATSPLNCQKAISKNAIKMAAAELKAIQKCRNAVESSPPKITGILKENCATADPTLKTQAAIVKAESKARAGISKKCIVDADLTTIGLCPSTACSSYCGTCNAACAGDCIVATHHAEIDSSDITISDILDVEYGFQNVCGDGAVESSREECDGTDDALCPGDCGAPDGPFPCLCMNGTDTTGAGVPPRDRVIEHAVGSDLDNGWTGTSHDAGTVEGGGYISSLYDCDGPLGPDTICNVGSTCSLAPHASCAVSATAAGGTTGDSICAGLGQGTCRKDLTAVGPHCKLDIQKKCNTLADCTGPGNDCVTTFHGPPLPLAAGGTEVCVVNIFTEDVVGTKDVTTGSSAVHIRQVSQTWGTFAAPPPCPVCGNFCQAGPTGNRHLCTVDGDCADVGPAHHCITDHVCSGGTKQDNACRHDPPYGGPTAIFGNPSVDCPPGGITGGTDLGDIDIIFSPATTGATTVLPSIQCDQAAFSGKACVAGSNSGAPCTNDSECPSGSCSFQCFCPTGGGLQERPNGCDPACVGGSNDAAACISDTECPSGFCHKADCREDLSAPAVLQPNEGSCTQTLDHHCSTAAYKGCLVDFDCTPAGGCPYCQAGETCLTFKKNCFINTGITRQGVADPDNPKSVSNFCIASTSSSAVNGTAGLPGPGALFQPETLVHTGF